MFSNSGFQEQKPVKTNSTAYELMGEENLLALHSKAFTRNEE